MMAVLLNAASHAATGSFSIQLEHVGLLSTSRKKIALGISTCAHAQDFAASDKLLLAILKAFVLHPLNKQQAICFRVFTYTRHL
jgi:hypothetical protein